MAEEKGEEKRPRIIVKGQEVTENDYRFLITVLLILGGFALSAVMLLRDRVDSFGVVMAVFGPLITMAVQSYFKSKE